MANDRVSHALRQIDEAVALRKTAAALRRALNAEIDFALAMGRIKFSAGDHS